jgi:hypothetical protein
VEKKHVETVLKAAGIPQRYDLAMVTAQGFFTRDTKRLLQRICEHGIPVLAAHDCDPAGYEIARTLAEATRTFRHPLEVMDLGLTVADARQMGLESEEYAGSKAPSEALVQRLTAEERDFFFPNERNHFQKDRPRRRVELDAMASGQLVRWVEAKLQEHGLLPKVCPPAEVALETARRAREAVITRQAEAVVRAAIEDVLGTSLAALTDEAKTLLLASPDGLEGLPDHLREWLGGFPLTHWTTWMQSKGESAARASFRRMQPEVQAMVLNRINTSRGA